MFLFLETDSFEARSRFSGSIALRSQNADSGTRESEAAIRRPYRGIQIKKDTYATLSVRKASGEAIPLTSSSERNPSEVGTVSNYSDFILQSVQEQRMEKKQIIETFGGSFVYFYGEQPRIVTISGLLMNTEDFNWKSQFWYNYDNFLRGSKLVQLGARCYLGYDTSVIEGYPLSASAVDTADEPYQVPFQMTMLLTNLHEYSLVGATRFPGVRAEDLSVLNKSLSDRRKSFESTTVEVRRANLNAKHGFRKQLSGSNSALSALRTGIRGFNAASSVLGDKLDVVNRLIGGRTLRIPIGAAAFLSALSDGGELAPGSITTSATTAFDPVTGERSSTFFVNGVPIKGARLRVLGNSKFAPSWTSSVNGSDLGYIFENYDEYPLLKQPSSLEELGLSRAAITKIRDQRLKKELEATAHEKELIAHNIMAASGNLLTSLAGGVAAIREGYGLALTASQFIADPQAIALASLGIDQTSAGILAGLPGQAAGLAKKIGEGIRRDPTGLKFFVGLRSKRGWANWQEQMISNRISTEFQGWDPESTTFDREDGPARIGDAYEASEYLGNASQGDVPDKAYEDAYGDNDYTALIESGGEPPESGDITDLTPEETAAAEASAAERRQALDEAYGNTDAAGFGDNSNSPSSVEEVYGSEGTITRTQMTGEERAAALALVYGNSTEEAADETTGIRSDSGTGTIDPVV